MAHQKSEPETVRPLILGFREHYAGTVTVLKNHLSTGNRTEALRLIRSLINVAAELGVQKIADAAFHIKTQLEDPTKQNFNCRTLQRSSSK